MRSVRTATLVSMIGAGDVLFVPVLFSGQLSDIAESGVFGAVMFDDRAGENAAAIWFASKGVLLLALGLLGRAHERATGTLPASPGWLLAGLGAAGAAAAPVSGFWVYLALGVRWIRDARREPIASA
jgi:hypothetical protein